MRAGSAGRSTTGTGGGADCLIRGVAAQSIAGQVGQFGEGQAMSDVCVHGAQGGTDAAVAEAPSQPVRRSTPSIVRPGATMMTIAFGPAIDLVSMVVGELQDVVAHHRGGAVSGAGFSLVIDGTDGRARTTNNDQGNGEMTTGVGVWPDQAAHRSR